MSTEEKKEDGGGLMYQQLRKFINVIVSKDLFIPLDNIFLSDYRMNCVMLVFNNSLNFQELQCLVVNQLVNHLF